MRVGIIGAGIMGRTHARAWKGLGAQVWVHDQGRERAAQLAQEFGLTVCDTVDGLISEVDVVDICLPTFLHKEMVERAAKAGRHVVCEKPLALSVQDGEAMIEACEAAGVRLFVAMVLRFFPQYRRSWELVRAGRIGDPQVLRLRRVTSPPYGGASWYADEARSGGVMLDLMLHDLDYAMWIAGNVTRVYARLNEAGTRSYAQAVLTHESGAVSLIESGWAYPDGMFRTAIDLAGAAGLIEWTSDSAARVQQYGGSEAHSAQGVAIPSTTLAEDPYALQLQHFRAALEAGTPFDVTPHEALNAVRVALAALESARSGRAVELGGGA